MPSKHRPLCTLLLRPVRVLSPPPSRAYGALWWWPCSSCLDPDIPLLLRLVSSGMSLNRTMVLVLLAPWWFPLLSSSPVPCLLLPLTQLVPSFWHALLAWLWGPPWCFRHPSSCQVCQMSWGIVSSNPQWSCMTLFLVHGRLVLPCCLAICLCHLAYGWGWGLVDTGMTFVVDLKCLGIIRWLVILPTWCLFTGMFHFRTLFALKLSVVWLLKGPSFTLSVMFLFGPEWTELPDFKIFILSSYRRWFLLAVLLPITDIHISARSHSSGLLSSLYFGILETVHSWTWNVDLSWSDRLRCRLFLLRAACHISCTGPEVTAFCSEIGFLINWSYLPFNPWCLVVT